MCTIYLVTFIACIFLCRFRPLNTRGISPFLTLFCLFAQTLMEIRNYFDIPTYQGSLCVYLSIGYYPLQQIVFIMILLYFIRYFAIINLNENKNSLLNKMSRREALPKLTVLRSVFLKVISSTWFTLGFVVVSYVLCVIIYLIVLAGYSFVCRFKTLIGIKVINNIELIIVYLLTILSLVVDVLLNYKMVFKKCKIIEYVFYSDPYWFRFQIILFLPFMIYSLCVELFSVIAANSYQGIVSNHTALITLNTLSAQFLLILDVLFPLSITIYELIKRLIWRPRRHNISLDDCLETTVTREMFVEYAKKEFSIENYLVYQDIKEYNTSSDKESIATHIYNTYLNGSASVMEINIDRKSCTRVNEKIQAGNFDEGLFKDVQKTVVVNLYDTFARFTVSSQFIGYLDNDKKQTELLEGKKQAK
jgi:hypothetical protein